MGIRRRHEAMQSSTFFLVALAAVLAAACASDSDLYAQESELFQNILKEQPEPPIPEKPMTKQVDPAKKHKLRGGKNPAKLRRQAHHHALGLEVGVKSHLAAVSDRTNQVHLSCVRHKRLLQLRRAQGAALR